MSNILTKWTNVFLALFETQKRNGAKNKSLFDGAYNYAPQTRLGQNSLYDYTRAIDSVRYASDYTLLVQIYNEVQNDGDVFALLQNRFAKTLSKFVTKDLDGNPNEIFAKYFDKKWFYESCNQFLLSRFFGYSVSQLLYDNKGMFYDISFVERNNFNPVNEILLSNAGGYTGEPLNARQKYELGLLIQNDFLPYGLFEKIAPLMILKKAATLQWNLFNQKFGTPTTIIKSMDVSQETMLKFQDFAENIGLNSWGVLGGTDEFELHEAKNSEGKNYENYINYLNATIAKIVLGSEKESSNYSEADSKQSDFETIVSQDRRELLAYLNEEFIPFVKQYKYYSGLPDFQFDFDLSSQLPVLEQIKIDGELLRAGVVLSKEYLEQKYKVQIDSVGTAQTPNVPIEPPKKKVFELIKDLYDTNCDCGHTEKSFFAQKSFELTGLWTIIDKLIKSIYDGKQIEFDAELATFYAQMLSNSYADGYDKPDKKTEKYILENLYKFSAAKTIQEIKDFKELLLTPDGKVKPFTEFRQSVIDRATVFNENYLKTEYDMVYTVAQNTRVWTDGIAAGFKLITYRTVGDGRVRPEHRALNGITLKANDAFWNSYTPPNGWNCRCTIAFSNDATLSGKGSQFKTLGEAALDNKKQFGTNFATAKEIFNEAHPYFSGLTSKQEQTILDFNP